VTDRIRLSELGSYYLSIVKQRLELAGQPNYVAMRIAFGRSIQVGKVPEYKEKDKEIITKAKERGAKEQPTIPTFEQEDGLLFKAILTQKYDKFIEQNEYADLLTKHVEHGLYVISKETEKLKGYDYISAILPDTIVTQDPVDAPQITKNSNDEFEIKVRIGVEKKSQEPIHYSINTANNPHFGITGGSGSGKTYFIKHLLKEIRQQSNYQTHFIVFDYKDGDIAKDDEFINATQAQVIDVKKEPLPLNLFADVVQSNQKDQKARAERIVNIVKNVEASIGKVQEQNLYQAILNAFEGSSPYPDFEAIRDELLQISDKPDSLTSVLRPLVEQEYFAQNNQKIWTSWTNKTAIIDIHEIESKDLVCFFVLNQIHNELKKLGVAPTSSSNARQLRIVVVIDEAHYFLSSKKRSKILQDMIRDVRSSGGAIILASQSPDDYDKTEFNFLELIEFPIVLGSTPKSSNFLEQKFGLSRPQAKIMLQEVSQLEQGEAFISNDKKAVKVELCK